MEVLRVPPYPIVTTWSVPSANAPYTIYVEDVVDHSVETLNVTSSANSEVTYTLPRSKIQYDRDFVFRIYDTNIYGEIVTDSNLTVYRPYVDPNTLGTTAAEIAEYQKWEIIARSIIDAYIGNDSATGEGFYNHKLVVQTVGLGTDYFPLWHNVKRVLKVYENNILVYDAENSPLGIPTQTPTYSSGSTTITTSTAHGLLAGQNVLISGVSPSQYNGTYAVTAVPTSTTFTIVNSNITATTAITSVGSVSSVWDYTYKPTLDNSAVIRVETDTYNRIEQGVPRIATATGDLGFYGRYAAAFPKGYDYIMILDVGYKAVPPDVEQAAIMLIEDLKCGNNDNYKRFVTQYSTDQFDIKFAPQFLGGTGNNIVDKILDGYKGSVIKPGII